jgi:hypothetical protein
MLFLCNQSFGESGSSGHTEQKKVKQALLSLFILKKRPQIATREGQYINLWQSGHCVYWRNKRAREVFGLDNPIDGSLQSGNMILGHLEVPPIHVVIALDAEGPSAPLTTSSSPPVAPLLSL